jgi:hypothetical protein
MRESRKIIVEENSPDRVETALNNKVLFESIQYVDNGKILPSRGEGHFTFGNSGAVLTQNIDKDGNSFFALDFMPEGQISPAQSQEKKIKYVRMFAYGIYSLATWILEQRNLQNKAKAKTKMAKLFLEPVMCEFHTNREMITLSEKMFGQYAKWVDDKSFKIDIEAISKDAGLLQKLRQYSKY